MRPINFGRKYVRLNGPVKLRINVRNMIVTAILFGATIVAGFLR